MKGTSAGTSQRVALLFTRYPVATETFLQREVEALRHNGLPLDILSLWPPPGETRSGESATRVFRPWELLSLFFWIPLWTLRRPRAMARMAATLIDGRPPNFINVWENLLGLGYAIVHAAAFRARYGHFHAVWASAPATAAWALSLLTDKPFSMAGHAYDLFEDGGDGLLSVKIPAAAFIRTSTLNGYQRWIGHGADPDAVHVVRRGLASLPPFQKRQHPESPWKFLSVGRLVEKMGHDRVLQVLFALDRAGCDFEACFIGEGPLLPDLERLATRLGLENRVRFTGGLPYTDVETYYQKADLFLFGGRIAKSGDRAGFPNAIGEAMAWGVPVCSTPVGAVQEGIRDGKTGLLYTSAGEAARKITALMASPEQYAGLRQAARAWIEEHFDARRNMRLLIDLLEMDPGGPTSRRQIRNAGPGS